MPIVLHDLTKRYQKQEVISHLSLQLPESGVLCLQGPSGCGKSTLLRLIAALEKPDSGKITGIPEKISMVFQEHRLFPWLTALQNIETVAAGQNHILTPLQWLEAMELDDARDKYPEELSGGMCQRIALARALYYGGDLLLLDEPFKGLDDATKRRVMFLLQQHITAKLTLFVTHDTMEAESFSDCIYRFSGPPLCLLSKQELRQKE